MWRKILNPPTNFCAKSRQLHVTAASYAGKRSRPKQSKDSKNGERQQKSHVTPEMKTVTRDVAKSLGGNWTKTAEELLARLASHQERPAESASNDTAQDTQSTPLLHSMRVRRQFDTRGRGKERGRERSSREQRFEDFDEGGDSRSIPRVQMKRQIFKDLFGEERLGIFSVDCAKKGPKTETGPVSRDLWQDVERDTVRRMLGAVPQNAFEEMARWTKEGKLWKFPVNNEEDMHEESQVKFYEHIFLDQHLGEFPDNGPIRKFMELVCLGLGSNPWLSVQEKRGHIRWYADYFREKEEVLVASLGEEQGKMKDKQL